MCILWQAVGGLLSLLCLHTLILGAVSYLSLAAVNRWGETWHMPASALRLVKFMAVLCDAGGLVRPSWLGALGEHFWSVFRQPAKMALLITQWVHLSNPVSVTLTERIMNEWARGIQEEMETRLSQRQNLHLQSNNYHQVAQNGTKPQYLRNKLIINYLRN